MSNSTLQKNNKRINIRGLAVLLVLVVLILVPILSSAATSTDEPDNRDQYHGWLDISAAKNISLPFKNGLITTEDIVAAANPVSVLTRPTARIDDSVVPASYSISENDLRLLNAATNINQSVVVMLEGQYEYYCTGCSQNKTVTGHTNVKVNFTAPTYKVTFDGNGGTIDGVKLQVKNLASNNKNGIAAGSIIPAAVKRDGYKFKGWSLSKEKYSAFTSETIVTDDITVYAFWEKIPGKKPDKPDKPDKPSEKEPKAITENHTATETRFNIVLAQLGKDTGVNERTSQNDNGPQNNIGNKTKVYTKAEFVSLAQDQSVPVANIGSGSVPLFAPEGAGGWAFINLLLAAMGIVMALACLVIALKDGKNLRSLWFIVASAAGVVGIVLFFLTENFKLNMVLADQWTFVNAILFIVTIVSMILFLRKKEDPEEFIYKY